MPAVAICSALVWSETWSSLPFPWCSKQHSDTVKTPYSNTHTLSIPYKVVEWDEVMNWRHRVTSIRACLYHINLSQTVNNSLVRGQTGTSHQPKPTQILLWVKSVISDFCPPGLLHCTVLWCSWFNPHEVTVVCWMRKPISVKLYPSRPWVWHDYSTHQIDSQGAIQIHY